MLFEDLMMRLFLITFVGLFFLQTVVPAQDAKVSPDVSERSAVSTGGLQFFSDTGVFRGPESGLMRLEVFCWWMQSSLLWCQKMGC